MKKILWHILFICLLVVLLTACEQTTEATLTEKEETVQEPLIDKSTFLSDYTYGKIVDEAFISDYNLVFFKNDLDKDYILYDAFIIYDNDFNLLFDSTKHLDNFYGVKHENSQLLCESVDTENQLLYIFKAFPSASSYGKTLILAKRDTDFQIAFNKEADIHSWRYYNDDSYIDFFGYTQSGGQTSFDEGFGETFIYNLDGQYIASLYYTDEYYDDQVDLMKEIWTKTADYQSFDNLCHAMALTGEVDELNDFVTQNKDMYSHLDELDADVFLSNYAFKGPMMAEEYEARWSTYKKALTEAPFLISSEYVKLYSQLIPMTQMDIDKILNLFGREYHVIARTFHTEYILEGEKDIYVLHYRLDHTYPFEIITGSFFYGSKLMFGSPIAIDTGEIKKIMVYSLDGTDYMSFYNGQDELVNTYHVQGIIYPSIKVTTIDNQPTITFDQRFRDGTELNTSLRYTNGRF